MDPDDVETPATKAAEFHNTSDAAKKLGLKPKTLHNWRSANRGPAFVKLGGRVFYPTPDLEAFVAANRHEPRVQLRACRT